MNLIYGKTPYEQRIVDNFMSSLNKEIAKIEIRLKVMVYPVENIEEAYGSLVHDQSREDFEKILTLKGVKKGDLANYKYKAK